MRSICHWRGSSGPRFVIGGTLDRRLLLCKYNQSRIPRGIIRPDMAIPDTGKEDDVSNPNWKTILEECLLGSQEANEMKEVINRFLAMFVNQETASHTSDVQEFLVELTSTTFFKIVTGRPTSNWHGDVQIWVCQGCREKGYPDSQKIWKLNDGAQGLPLVHLQDVYCGLPALLEKMAAEIPAVRTQIDKYQPFSGFRRSRKYNV